MNLLNKHSNNVLKAISIGLGLLLATPYVLQAQENFSIPYDYDFASPRSNAMAEAYTSEALFVSDMYANPAGLAFITYDKDVQSIVHLQPSTQLMGEHFVFPVLYNMRHRAGFGYSYTHRGVQGLNNWLSVRNIPVVPSFSQHRMDLGYAYKLFRSFSIGGLLSTQRSYNPDQSRWTHMTTMGIHYQPTPDVSYAFVYKGLGTQLEYQMVDGATLLETRGHPHTFEVGSSFRFPTATSHPYVTLSLTNTKVLHQNGIWYKIGGEVRPIYPLALRGGYLTGPVYDGARVGLGLYTRFVILDYSFSPHPDVRHRFHQIGVSFNLNALHKR